MSGAIDGKQQAGSGGNLGFERDLCAAADAMRGHMESAEYKHVALGLIFLKSISDIFGRLYDKLADPEDRDCSMSSNSGAEGDSRQKIIEADLVD